MILHKEYTYRSQAAIEAQYLASQSGHIYIILRCSDTKWRLWKYRRIYPGEEKKVGSIYLHAEFILPEFPVAVFSGMR